MNKNESTDWEPTPSAEELLRLTSRSAAGDFAPSSAARDAFLAFGESAENAAKDFDWQKLVARLSCEIESESAQRQLSLPSRAITASRRGAFTWISICSAAVLLIALGVCVFNQPAAKTSIGKGEPSASNLAGGIDSWARTPLEGEFSPGWNDELDVQLAAARRSLKQGRDPWVNDEPALSNVFAQVNDLSAGLVLEPF